MPAYDYGEPRKMIPRALDRCQRRWPRARIPAIAVALAAGFVLSPIAWALVQAGRVGHWIAEDLLGFESREWWE